MSLESSNLLRAALASLYGIAPTTITPIDYGIMEASYKVEVGKERFFAKQFLRTDRQTAAMERGIGVCQTLLAEGFPAPKPIPTQSGAAIGEVDGRRFLVTEWIDGLCYRPGTLPSQCAYSMGQILGVMHKSLGFTDSVGVPPFVYTPPAEARDKCHRLLEKYIHRTEPFARFGAEILKEQIELLEHLPTGYADTLPKPSIHGYCFNSFWCEQLLFNENGDVVAVVDWTDGAGRQGRWAEDVKLGIHLSAMSDDAIVRYVSGYQSANPLPLDEWIALCSSLLYGHLSSTNFLGAWLDYPYPRLRQWEQTAKLWHSAVIERFKRREYIEALILDTAAATSKT